MKKELIQNLRLKNKLYLYTQKKFNFYFLF